MNAKEYAAKIRSEYKAKGWSARQISVRSDYFSMGSSVDVEIKDVAIPLPVAKAIAEQAESIRRCERTGEILSGGNRYVSVRYSHEAQQILGRRYADAVQRAVNAVEPGSNTLQPVDGTEFLVGRPNEWAISLWDRDAGHLQQNNTVDGVAQTIGSLMVAREAARA